MSICYSERVGSVPHEDVLAKLEPEFKSEHKVLKGLSVTEMEIVYAAYHVNNPNGKNTLSTAAVLEVFEATDRHHLYVFLRKSVHFYNHVCSRPQIINQR